MMSLIILLIATFGAYYFTSRDANPSVDPDIFRVDGLEDIDSVELVSKQQSSALHYNGSRWMVNGSHRADAQMIEVLFATLAQVVPKRPVSENMRDSIANVVRTDGIRVALYADGALKKEFFVGGNAQKSEAYFLSATDGPFIMTIPGYRVYVAGVFELDEQGWRDKQVFRFNQRNFRQLTASFVKDVKESFDITYEDRVFEIPGIESPDTTRIFDYLDGVALLKADQLYRPGSTRWIDSLLNVQPSFSIEVTDTQGRSSRLVIYPPVGNQQLVAGRMGDEPALFQKTDILKIAKKKSYFQTAR